MFSWLLVDRERDLGEPADAVAAGTRGARSRCASSAWYCRVRQASVAVRMLLEVVDRQRDELDADREAPLQLGDQVRRLRQVERARRDEQDVVGLDHPVLGRDRRALDERQQVALHALARDVGAVHFRARLAILSISSRNTMPFCSTLASALRLDLVVVDAASPASSSVSAFSASAIFILLQPCAGRRPSAGTCPGSATSGPPCRAAP